MVSVVIMKMQVFCTTFPQKSLGYWTKLFITFSPSVPKCNSSSETNGNIGLVLLTKQDAGFSKDYNSFFLSCQIDNLVAKLIMWCKMFLHSTTDTERTNCSKEKENQIGSVVLRFPTSGFFLRFRLLNNIIITKYCIKEMRKSSWSWSLNHYDS